MDCLKAGYLYTAYQTVSQIISGVIGVSYNPKKHVAIEAVFFLVYI